TTWACRRGASCAARVVFPDPAGPSTATTVVVPQRGWAARAAAVIVATAGFLVTRCLIERRTRHGTGRPPAWRLPVVPGRAPVRCRRWHPGRPGRRGRSVPHAPRP